MIRRYDEGIIFSRLSTLGRREKTGFAVACAQSLIPTFERYARIIEAPAQAGRLATIVDTVWAAASGERDDLAALEGEAEAMVPDDQGAWGPVMAYGQHAAAAAEYAVRTWLTDSAEQAVWAAQQVYEFADYVELRARPDFDLNSPSSEALILGSDRVQGALLALDEALEVAESEPSTWTALRVLARGWGETWAIAIS